MSKKESVSPTTFPCDVFIKAIGENTPDLEGTVLTILKRYVNAISENAIKLTPSKNGRYLSVTIKITAQNKEQLDAIYQALSLCDKIIMAL